MPPSTTPCQVNACAADTGLCELANGPAGESCEDGDACTDTGTCNGSGTCVTTPLDCDDGKPCTLDDCNSSGCIYSLLVPGTECDTDGDACTIEECSGSSCQQVSSTICYDGYSCTSDSCDSETGNCVFTPNDAACNDGSLYWFMRHGRCGCRWGFWMFKCATARFYRM